MKKDLLKLLDLSKADIVKILDTADQMKYNQKHSLTHQYLAGKTLAMIFEKNSTRTRVSFETGMFQLGGHALFLSGKESQIGRGEPIEDTARVLSRYCDGIMIRTFGQQEVEKLAQYASIPVINGLTDFAHPCQVLADLMTVREHKSRLEGLKLCYIGDGNNMANSLIVGGLKVGMDVSVACPEGYDPAPQVLDFAKTVTGSTFTLCRDPKEAAADADVLEQRLGKGGRLLHAYANGYDPAPVHRIADLPPPKSIGNSATAPRDLICEADARAALLSLAESVGARLRLEGYQCRTVELSVRTADLHWRSHRMALRHPSDLTSELLDAALALCEQAHLWPDPLRSIGIRALDLVPACAPHQLDLFEDAEHRARQRQLDITLDNLRARYGKTCVLRGRACFDPALGLVQHEEHAFLRK